MYLSFRAPQTTRTWAWCTCLLELSKLQELELDGNQITAVPDNAFLNLVELKILELNENQISTVSQTSFKGLSKLLRLEISKNLLQELPDNIFEDLLKLKILRLHTNHLKKLSTRTFGSKGAMQNIYSLFVGGNQLVEFESNFFRKFPSLTYVDFTNTPLTVLPNISGIDTLKTFSIANTKVSWKEHTTK